MKRIKCLICASSDLTRILDLGNHPFADTFVHPARACDMLPVYNLSCDMCVDCGQIQTAAITDPNDRYHLHDYSYTSSNSSVSRNHWRKFCGDVCEEVNLSRGHRVLEIGSNDGYLLRQFKTLGLEALGIDASSYVSQIAIDSGIETLVEIFDSNIAKTVVESHGKFDLVVANNVFNHSDNPLSFARGVNNVLADGGTFVYELPYWRCAIESKKIDQIYHEHVSYFTARSSKKIMELSGFRVRDIDVVDYHGGSLRVYAQKTDEDHPRHCQKLLSLIHEEGPLFNSQTYYELMTNLNQMKWNFLMKIMKIKLSNFPIVAIGAAAKGNTFLKFLNLDNTIVEYVTDTSSHKQGKITPLTNIPIVDDEMLSKYGPMYAIILSWNISDEIRAKLLKINPEIRFLSFY